MRLLCSLLIIHQFAISLAQEDLYSGIPWVPQVTPEGLPISREDTVSHAQDKAQEILKTYRNDDINVAMKDTQSNLQITNKTSSVGFRESKNISPVYQGNNIQVTPRQNTIDPTILNSEFVPPRPIGPVPKPSSAKSKSPVLSSSPASATSSAPASSPASPSSGISSSSSSSSIYSEYKEQQDLLFWDQYGESSDTFNEISDSEVGGDQVKVGDWIVQWDKQLQAWYYYNTETDESTWNRPTELKDYKFELFHKTTSKNYETEIAGGENFINFDRTSAGIKQKLGGALESWTGGSGNRKLQNLIKDYWLWFATGVIALTYASGRKKRSLDQKPWPEKEVYMEPSISRSTFPFLAELEKEVYVESSISRDWDTLKKRIHL